jgi:hypothetical protein
MKPRAGQSAAKSELSIARCRGLLGAVGTRLSDEEVVRLRDQIYDVAHSVVEAYERDVDDECDREALRQLSIDEPEEIEERAAMLQFDGNMTRREATRTALAAWKASKPPRRGPRCGA